MVVRSYSKVNLGLAIGPVRGDGFHGLATMYQTIGLYDVVTVMARRMAETKISLTSNNPRVPTDGRNTAWKMVEGTLRRLGVGAEVSIHIDKRLPVQGGMGAGSANAAAVLIGLERELGVEVPGRMQLAAGVGSDVPLFLVGGAVIGEGRGDVVSAARDFPAMWCVAAVPEVGVSTPGAFRDWDARHGTAEKTNTGPSAAPPAGASGSAPDDKSKLTQAAKPHRMEMLSRMYASYRAGPAGISNLVGDLAENHLLALVHAGIENDFEEVVFPQYPSLRELKRQLIGDSNAVYAALSGSGSTVFGLYGSEMEARAAQQRARAMGVEAYVTKTLPREQYWHEMFAE